ncbi:MAG TPA: vitamin K epoxide reductase family protein [Verrucomicrobiae bacterium]|nr:vitamin K epoxide reductase family protein [Verrucomicrobiae bacterium]
MPKTTRAAARKTEAVTVGPLKNLPKILPWLLTICGVLGITASLILTYDQVQIWKNPRYVPACNLNPLVSCGGVITSGKGELFHIPGPFFGLLAFPVIVTIGIGLLAGAKYTRWFWQGLQLSALAGVVFALWMFWVSLFQIHALCPFCLSVDIVMYVFFWYVTLYNLQQENITSPSRLKRGVDFSQRHHLDILIAWFLILTIYTLYHFWYYFGQHI